MNEQEIEDHDVPPLETAYAEPIALSRWPKVFGILSIVIAIIGMLCQSGVVSMIFLSGLLQRIAGISMEIPPVIKLIASASLVVYLILGIMLLIGGIRTLRRQPGGVKLLKAWAVLRMIMVVISFVLGYLLLPTSVEMQRSMTDSINKKLREANQPEQPFDEDSKYRLAMIEAFVGAGITSIYPLTLGFFLSRRKIDDEVAEWDTEFIE